MSRPSQSWPLTGIDLVVKVAIVSVAALMLLRCVLTKTSPFGWLTFRVRGLTEPLVAPFSEALPFSLGDGIAPLLAVLVTVITAYFFKWVAGDTVRAVLGLIDGISEGGLFVTIGWAIYGSISILLALILMRIVVSWLPFARGGRDPGGALQPHRAGDGTVPADHPPLGMLDLSPIILIFLLNFVQNAVHSMLIR